MLVEFWSGMVQRLDENVVGEKTGPNCIGAVSFNGQNNRIKTLENSKCRAEKDVTLNEQAAKYSNATKTCVCFGKKERSKDRTKNSLRN